jgi:hypothetical protein
MQMKLCLPYSREVEHLSQGYWTLGCMSKLSCHWCGYVDGTLFSMFTRSRAIGHIWFSCPRFLPCLTWQDWGHSCWPRRVKLVCLRKWEENVLARELRQVAWHPNNMHCSNSLLATRDLNTPHNLGVYSRLHGRFIVLVWIVVFEKALPRHVPCS